ncbi:MAG: hypothetical protein GAK31_02495 [Stenotrophomonas maltophilia]|uniref:DUF4124 domain-containing protein n=1 Tax=Stenotrophomonas maltophilia TaxID=40324 RepID=A0A7V8FGD4_STEMA|nr:MAG: hypothetical protein GAK31_02495 [Stenotrophomonas maltophilia]
MKTLIWLALALLPGSALADDTVIYRCTSSSGVPALQRTPCPDSSTQRIHHVPDAGRPVPVQVPPAAETSAAPLPAAAAPTADPTPPKAGDERTIMEARMVDSGDGDTILGSALLPRRGQPAAAEADAAPKPPLPAIFQCQAEDGGRYLHEREPAPPRCVMLQVSGLGGGATPVNAASCKVVRDTCSEVAAEQACGSWQQRFRDARGRERFASPDTQAEARAERERLQGVLEASSCPVPQ